MNRVIIYYSSNVPSSAPNEPHFSTSKTLRERPDKNPLEPVGFPAAFDKLRPAFLHGETTVSPTPFVFKSGLQYRQNRPAKADLFYRGASDRI